MATQIARLLSRRFEWPELRALERGELMPTSDVAAALATAYRQPVEVLLGPESEEERPASELATRPPEPEDRRSERLRLRSPYRPRAVVARPSTAWDLRPGDEITRIELHDRYGGGRRGGIAPSRQSPNVFVFSDPSTGHQHGYFDRWDEAGEVFLYCGEGQVGDQEMIRGNAAILNHRREGRALRLFEGSGGVVRYAGEFELASGRPYLEERAPSTGGGRFRRVFLFRLVPVD
jgi:hypothetical protein